MVEGKIDRNYSKDPLSLGLKDIHKLYKPSDHSTINSFYRTYGTSFDITELSLSLVTHKQVFYIFISFTSCNRLTDHRPLFTLYAS